MSYFKNNYIVCRIKRRVDSYSKWPGFNPIAVPEEDCGGLVFFGYPL
jgi:hypothetical protein